MGQPDGSVVTGKRPLDPTFVSDLIDPVRAPEETAPLCLGTLLHLECRAAVDQARCRSKAIRARL